MSSYFCVPDLLPRGTVQLSNNFDPTPAEMQAGNGKWEFVFCSCGSMPF